MEVIGVDIPVYIILTVLTVVLLYIYSTWHYTFFRDQNIPGPRPYPFLGNTLGQGLMHSFPEWKQTYGNVFGIFVGPKPAFVISDLDILREMLVKRFNNFRNRRTLPMVGYPLNLGVFFLEDAAWKRVRNIIKPSFSGGKLRNMCSAINDCSRTLTKNFTKTLNQGKSVNMKEYFGAYTMDVISRTAFGVKVDSQNDLNDPFTSHAKKIFSAANPIVSPLFKLIGFFPFLIPLVKAFGLSSFPRYIMDFFVKNISDMIKERQLESKEEREKRTDFLQLLMDAEIEDNWEDSRGNVSSESGDNLPNDIPSVRRLTKDEIIGQGVLFFIAGYETTASTLNFVSYLLATHPDVQEKLHQEISDVLGNGEPDYDNIAQLKYLDNVINETLRLYPPFVALHRKASETTTVKGITVPRGVTIYVPVFSIQRNPEIFVNPDEFKPERFNEKTNPLSFLPFGHGPRICIGMRLALVETKLALIHVLRKVKFQTSPDTPVKLTFRNANVLLPKEPNMLQLTARR